MSRLFLVLVLAVTGLSVVTGAPSAAVTATRSIEVAGTGVGMYPEFDPAVERYGITTAAGTGGSVQVTATTSDPDGTALVNGVPASGPTTVTGLAEGDEVSVIFEDTDGTTVHSLVYLPSRFPRLEVTHNGPDTAPGVVGLGLSEWNTNPDHFETAIDRNGVPAHVRRLSTNSMDFKRQPDGSLSSSRTTTTPARAGHALHVLDEQLQSTSVHETVGLENTDGHDSIVLPNGHVVLLAYEFDAATELTDAVIQELDPAGDVVFEWNSADHIDKDTETTLRLGAAGDYAHINSVQVMADGHFLASFRHTSSVMKIARYADGGFAAGDVMWRLGGKLSDLDFVDDPHPGGPCAQHTAYEVAGGNILIFDNGSWRGFGDNPLCVDPADRTGASVERPFTRVTEYTVDEAAGTATLEWSYEQWMDDAAGTPTRLGALFAGSSIRLPNGNTLINWSPDRRVIATEVTADKEIAWQVRDSHPTTGERYFSYRAHKFELPDAIDPVVTVPTQAPVYVQGQAAAPSHACTDTGGSSLHSCDLGPDGLDTSTVGTHSATVTATDGAGNTTSRSYAYEVVPAARYRPDGVIRANGSRWVGNNVYGAWRAQEVGVPLRRAKRTKVAEIRLQNDGNVTERFRVAGTKGNRDFSVRYVHAGKVVTKGVTAGTWRAPSLSPGAAVTLRVRVTRTKKASNGDRRRFVIRASSTTGGVTDRVAALARARR